MLIFLEERGCFQKPQLVLPDVRNSKHFSFLQEKNWQIGRTDTGIEGRREKEIKRFSHQGVCESSP